MEEMADAWRSAIERPPRATCRVLVALDDERLVGFATTVPSADEDATPAEDGEIDQLVVDPVAQRRGHGSRLLNACADTLRADGFRRATAWVGGDDDVAQRFLAAAGWALDGASRQLGSDLTPELRLRQVRLHTDLADD